MMGHRIEGISELLEIVDCPVHVQRDEIEWIDKSTSVGADQLVGHESGDLVTVGSVDITLLHTPGHTPGSQCFMVDGRLVAGDTLFLEGCGRERRRRGRVSQRRPSTRPFGRRPEG